MSNGIDRQQIGLEETLPADQNYVNAARHRLLMNLGFVLCQPGNSVYMPRAVTYQCGPVEVHFETYKDSTIRYNIFVPGKRSEEGWSVRGENLGPERVYSHRPGFVDVMDAAQWDAFESMLNTLTGRASKSADPRAQTEAPAAAPVETRQDEIRTGLFARLRGWGGFLGRGR